MIKVKTLAKFVDQPLVVNKISDAAPAVLIGTSAALGMHDIFAAKHRENKSFSSRLTQNTIVLGIVSAASLISARGLTIKGKKIFNGLIDMAEKNDIIKQQTNAVTNFLKEFNPADTKLRQVLEKGKDKILSVKEVDYLLKSLEKNNNANNLLETLLGKKEELTSKEIFSEIGRLSLLGLVPVASGVGAGMLADLKHRSKEKNCDRIKEGAYQYLANIFLCNIGAGAALFGLEGLKKANIIKSITPSQKFFGMISGILATGVIGGSFIANYISKKVIDPLILKKKNDNLTFNNIYDERTPEGVDMCMHIDDIATAGVLSGLKWIEPVLPVFYLFSGYRAGMGYRNHNPHEHAGHKHHRHHHKVKVD